MRRETENISWFKNSDMLEKQVFPDYLMKCRWFGGKAKIITQVRVDSQVPLSYSDEQVANLLLLEVSYEKRLPEHYFLPVAFVKTQELQDHIDQTANTVIYNLDEAGQKGVLIDASYDSRFRNFILQSMSKKVKIKTSDGVLQFLSGANTKLPESLSAINSHVLKADQSNTSIIYNGEYFFKFYRKVEKEINPDLEIVRFLSEKTDFKNSPTYAGGMELKTDDGKSIVFGLLQEMVENQGEAWSMTMDHLDHYFEQVLKENPEDLPPGIVNKPALFLEDVPGRVREFITPSFYERVIKLGERTAEMHLALASDTGNPDFAPEKIDSKDQQSIFLGMQELLTDRADLLQQKLKNLPEAVKPLAEEILSRKEEIENFFRRIMTEEVDGIKTRIHGDYHLGQILFTGNDFIIIDYEGEPGFSFTERRIKKSPFKDVAGMIRSFHYAAYGKILLSETYNKQYRKMLEPWAEQWFWYVKKFYLAAYLDKMGMDINLTRENQLLLEIYTLEKAVYELGYELNSRPDWVIIPLRGIKFLIDQYKKR